MKKAFVHDRLFHMGGAETVFFDLIDQYMSQQKTGAQHPLQHTGSPQPGTTTPHTGCIYTLFSDKTSVCIAGKDYPIITALPTWINTIFVWGSTHHSIPDMSHYDLIDTLPFEEKYPGLLGVKTFLNRLNTWLMNGVTWLGNVCFHLLRKVFDYRNLIVIYPLLTRLLRNKLQASHPDHIIISSFAAAKNILPVGKVLQARTTLYLHSPMQYIRENYEEYLGKLAPRQLIIFKPLARKLRKRDKQPRHYDEIYTNSHYTKRCALQYYVGKHSISPIAAGNIIVTYPKLHERCITTPVSQTPRDYYLYIGRLVTFIRETDLVIHLANEIHIPLLVMGSGPDEHELKMLAGDTITFIGQVTDIDEKIEIIRHARGLINLTKESCGIGTMEALALGVPVLGYNAGATPEFVNANNGVLAQTKDMEHLIEKFQAFHTKERNRETIKKEFLVKYRG